jgi:hypothetical protein
MATGTLAASAVVLGAVPMATPPRVEVGELWGMLRGLGGGGESDDQKRPLICQGEVIADVEEGGEGSSVTKQGADMGEALVEAADHIEDESAVRDDFLEGTEVVGHLEAAVVLGDGDRPGRSCETLSQAGWRVSPGSQGTGTRRRARCPGQCHPGRRQSRQGRM